MTEVKAYAHGNKGFYYSHRDGKIECSPFVEDINVEVEDGYKRVTVSLPGNAEYEYREEGETSTIIFRKPSRWLHGYLRLEVLDKNRRSAWTNPIFL